MSPKAESVMSPEVERNLSRHAGKWIAFTPDSIVGSGDTPTEALAQARERGAPTATLFHVPSLEEGRMARFY